MNYYEHHLGDYAEATAHLSILEDGTYSRLIRKYYATEQPIPADVKTVQRLIGARTPAERQAVEAVLQEFFVLEEDGWHNERCDEEIARYLEAAPEREARRESDKERQRRSRERRRHLFEQLREVGIVAPYNADTAELDRLLSRSVSRVTGVTGSRDVTDPVTRDNTASQSPVPNPQSPVTSNQEDPDGGRRASRSVTGCRLPVDFALTPEREAYARERGIDPHPTFAMFTTYWRAKSGAGATKVDWDSTWQHWCLKDAKDRHDKQTPRKTRFDEIMEMRNGHQK